MREGAADGSLAPVHTAGAQVAVLTARQESWATISALVSDEATTAVRVASLAELEAGERPDVVVLDRGALADPDGILRRIRRRWLTSSIVVAGVPDDADAARLLEIGADDVVRAGSSLLAARLRAAARRARTVNAGTRIAVGDIVFDRESRRVWCAGREVSLTRTEEALLDCLFWYSPRPVSLAALTSFVWGGELTPEQRNLLHVYIGYLRGKLRGSRLVVIQTVRRVGYRFAARKEEKKG